MPVWGRPWTVVFLVVASVVISGLRTATLFVSLANVSNAPAVQLIEGLAAVAMVELGIVLTAFRAEQIRREDLAKPRHVANLRDLWRGLRVRLGIDAPRSWGELPERSAIPALHTLLFLTALVANVWITAQAVLLAVPGAGDLNSLEFAGLLLGQPPAVLLPVLVAVAVGAAAPVAAKVAGEAAARDTFAAQVQDEKAYLGFEQAVNEWRGALRQAWEADGLDLLEQELARQEARARSASAAPLPERGQASRDQVTRNNGRARPFA
ncbi:MAG: hypothetical protein M5R40_15780 [Anaerolineae bacterium]|nr:hypothetical protein [Anaerolineae bacterium]